MINTRVKLILLLLAVFGISGCSTVGYLSHTTLGHFGVVGKKESINSILENEKYDEKQREKLANVLRIRAFASEYLSLPDNKSYTEYVQLDRDYVTWSIFATPELSLEPTTWCFWIVGCVPYRGYFEEEKAEEFAKGLRETGHDVYIAPIPAYSTLGWFTDPVLSSMLRNGEIITAEYIFHELVHQQLYIKNDTSFNEAFATAVARVGVIDWLRAEQNFDAINRYRQALERRKQLFALTQQLRANLKGIYTASISDEEKRSLKTQEFAAHSQRINELTETWSNGEAYRRSVLRSLNNARLNAQSTYNDLIPDFIRLFEACDNSYSKLYSVVGSMESLTKEERLEYLRTANCTAVSNS